jgi:hypothetical protein
VFTIPILAFTLHRSTRSRSTDPGVHVRPARAHPPQELQKLLMPMPRLALANHLALQHI